MKQRKAVYPGSFDPLTNGHVDVIQRLLLLFDEVVILVARSPEKKYLFTEDERKKLIEDAFNGIKGISVAIHEGLTVNYLKFHGSGVIVRGLRAVSDYEYELAMANMNRRLAPEIETMIIFCRPEFNFVASRMVKEVAFHGGTIEGLVPPNVEFALKKKYQKLK